MAAVQHHIRFFNMNIGDIVKLKSDVPKMVVGQIGEQILCCRRDYYLKLYSSHYFNECMLECVDENILGSTDGAEYCLGRNGWHNIKLI